MNLSFMRSSSNLIWMVEMGGIELMPKNLSNKALSKINK